jgi:hypothetical protein
MAQLLSETFEHPKRSGKSSLPGRTECLPSRALLLLITFNIRKPAKLPKLEDWI